MRNINFLIAGTETGTGNFQISVRKKGKGTGTAEKLTFFDGYGCSKTEAGRGTGDFQKTSA